MLKSLFSRITTIFICVLMFIFVIEHTELQVYSASTMKTGEAGINLIKDYEKCHLTAYKATADERYYTIGWGHYGADVTAGMTITQAKADQMFLEDLVKYENNVNTFLNNNNITVSQNQFDALVSFTYNCGNVWVSEPTFKLKTYLITGVDNYTSEEITTAFTNWNKQNGKVLNGLTRRRQDEAALFLQDIEPHIHTVDPNYNTYVECSAPDKIYTYNEFGEHEGNRYVDLGDPCIAIEAYTDGCWKIDYPSGSTRRQAYMKLSEWNPFSAPAPKINTTVDTKYNQNVSCTAPSKIYTYDEYGNREGDRYVDPDDSCTAIEAYTSGYWKIDYPSGNTRRQAYMKLSEWNPFTAVHIHKVDSKYNTNVSCTAPSKIYTYDENGNHEGNRYVAPGDQCIAIEAYTDGCWKIDYPSGSTRRQAYMMLSEWNPFTIKTTPTTTKTTTTKQTTTTTTETATTTTKLTTTTTSTTNTTQKTTTTTTISQVETEIYIKVGEKYNIQNMEEVNYKSSNEDIAVVSNSGVITGISKGNVIITIIDKFKNTVTLTVHVIEPKYGDANGDNEVNISDAVIIMQSLANPSMYGFDGKSETHITKRGYINADCCNVGDGVTNADALAIQKYKLSLITSLPEKK